MRELCLLKTTNAVWSLDEMVQAPMTAFTGFLNRVREGREGFWSFHANDYIRKITLEYMKAPSRGQVNTSEKPRTAAALSPHKT